MEQSRCRGPAVSGPERQREATASSTRLAHHCSCGSVKLGPTGIPSGGSLTTQTWPTLEPSTTSSHGDYRCFQVDVEGPAVSGYTGCHWRHRPNRHPGVHRWVHPRRYLWWGSRDGGYEWGRHHRTMACHNRPMEQLVPSGEISDGESNLVARWVRGLAIGAGALRQQVPGRNPCEL